MGVLSATVKANARSILASPKGDARRRFRSLLEMPLRYLASV